MNFFDESREVWQVCSLPHFDGRFGGKAHHNIGAGQAVPYKPTCCFQGLIHKRKMAVQLLLDPRVQRRSSFAQALFLT